MDFTELYVRSQQTEHDNELARAELGSQVIAARRDWRRQVFAPARHLVTSVVGHVLGWRRRHTTPTVGTAAATHDGTP
jgi:hypothetical protein